MAAENQYEILGELGRGGMGVVHKARDKTLNRIVVLKVLSANLSQNPTMVKRFQREAKAAAGLNHPNIVTVYSVGKQDGVFHIAMEYVEGMSLAQLISKEGKRTVRTAVEMTRQAAAALAEAHAKQIVHRDIKPANIMIDRSNRIKVTDFGLARVVQDETELTMDGERLGTPRYMSPEQCEGRPLTFQTDIYSLGVVFYEMLTGFPPFRADSSLAVMRQIVDSEFPDIRQQNKDVPPEIVKVLNRMVAKKREARYESARVLSDDLKQWLQTGKIPSFEKGAVASTGIPALPRGSGFPPLAGDRTPLPSFHTGEATPLTGDKTPSFLSSVSSGHSISGARTRALASSVVDKDFLIHYVEPDRSWAEWVHLQLTEAGYKPGYVPWDFGVGDESMYKVVIALENSIGLISIVSPAYLRALTGNRAWQDLMRQAPGILPLRVRPCTVGTLFATLDYIDMVSLDHDKGREALLIEARERRGERSMVGADEAGETAVAPSVLLHAVSNLPVPSHEHFSGRGKVLSAIHDVLGDTGGTVALVQEEPELSGLGLTQIAAEFAHLNKSNYSVVWWVRAEDGAVCAADFAAMADDMDLPEKGSEKLSVSVQAVRKWLASNGGWLLVFDQAANYESLADFLPDPVNGHIIITSPNERWPKNASKLVVEGLERSESADFLFKATGQRNDGAAAALAAAMADVPLAMNLGTACINTASLSLDAYIDKVLDQHKALWGFRDPPRNAPAVTATALSISLEAVARKSRGALDLLKACIYLAPTHIRLSRLSSGAKVYPKCLSKVLTNVVKLNEAVAILKQYGLVDEKDDVLSMHRLVQELLREWVELDMNAEENEARARAAAIFQYNRFERKDRRVWATAAIGFIEELFPENPRNKDKWAECTQVMPHTLAVIRNAERLELKPEATAEILRRVGYYLFRRAEYSRAAGMYKRAIALHTKARGPKHRGLSRMYKEVAHIHWARSNLEEARADYEAALAIDEAFHKKAHEEIATTLYNLGNVLMQMGDLATARQYYLKALNTHQRVHGDEHANVGRDYTCLGLVSQELGDLTSAWDYYRKALEICEAVHGAKHPSVSAAVKNIAGLFQRMGDLASAKNYYKRAVKVDTALHGEHHPDLAQDYNNLGLVLQGLGFTREALVNYRKALAIDEAVYGKTHPKVAINKNNLANILRIQGDLEGAEAHYHDAVDILKAALGKNHEKTITAARNLKKIRAQIHHIKQEQSGPKDIE